MEEQVLRKLNVSKIIPARSWHYMYAYGDTGKIFIYAHRDRVQFFVNHELEDDIFNFQDTVTKLTALKYFHEKSDNCIANIKLIDFERKDSLVIKFGTCLVSFDLLENFKADIWIDNNNKTVEFYLKDAGELTKNFDSEISLPD